MRVLVVDAPFFVQAPHGRVPAPFGPRERAHGRHPQHATQRALHGRLHGRAAPQDPQRRDLRQHCY
eukprot:900151-Prorocentrum_minimum.AAC.1